MKTPVRITNHVRRLAQTKSIPLHIFRAFREWAEDVQEHGVLETRKQPGYHDEPIHDGARSVRLNIQWRLIYRESTEEGTQAEVIDIVLVTDITPHKYDTARTR